MPTENRTARLTILIDPRKKAVFERLCAADDTTPSQVVRQLIRDYIEQKSGHSWQSEYNLAEKASPAAKSPRGR
ncbi:MAG: CopG family transcriptional regulator [Rhodanobacter sp.]